MYIEVVGGELKHVRVLCVCVRCAGKAMQARDFLR